MVVDLAIADQPAVLLATGHGLDTGRVHDGEVARTEPGLTDPAGADPVRAAVGHPFEHPHADRLVEGPVRRHDR